MNKHPPYLRSHAITLTLLSAAFLSGIIFGAIAYPHAREQTEQLASMLKNLINTDSQLSTALGIFMKNMQASFIMLLLGPTLVMPFFIVHANGLLTGLVIGMAAERGKPLLKIAAGLMPHGIIELAVFFLTATLGMDVTLSAIRNKGRRLAAVKEAVIHALKTYITVVMPLLLIAAFIEAYISVKIIQ
ncbi:MAG: stage II sporulation protein M [Candidatus Altiarchaeota archaeon]|nr:stage II sporulation protein M [Candidatus Altiarchaeota archaeon]